MILKHELQKIFRIPIIWVLLLFFCGLNVLLTMSHADYKEDMTVLSKLVETYGHEINDEMLADFGKDYAKKVAWINSIAQEKGKIYEHPSEVLEDYKYDDSLSDAERQKLWNYHLIEVYYRKSQDIDKVYQELNLAASAESIIKMYGMQEDAANTVRTQFQKLDGRLDELIGNGEHKHLFFNNMVYEMHELLFEEIGRTLIFELMILIVLITAAIMNYEFENRTSPICYTTKSGRKLVIHKFAAAAISTFVVTSVLIGITFSIYFITYDYSGLMGVPISAYFNAEMPFPFITWWNLSFLEYLTFFILFVFAIQYLFMGFTFTLSIFMKNTYIVFFIFLVFAGAGILLPSFVPLKSNLVFYLSYTPFVMMLNPHEWLMGNGPFTIYKNYEAVTIGVWSVVICILCVFSIQHFKRQQLN